MKNKKLFSISLKIIIAGIALYFLFDQLIKKSSTEQFNLEYILNQLYLNRFLFGLVVVMMIMNWFVEIIKWKFIIKKIEDISLLRATRAIFSGITVSTFTPNRIGEYGGRVFCLEKADRVKGVLITIIGSIAQFLTTIIFGSIGIIIFFNIYDTDLIILENENLFDFLKVSLVFANILLIVLFLNSFLLSKYFSKIHFLKNYTKYTQVFSYYNTSELLKVLIYSVIRYLIFTSQFFILLNIFNLDISFFDSIVFTSILLLLISIVPTIAISEISIRASIAIFLFSYLTDNVVGIVSATFVLWIVNLLIPALIGTIFIFTLKFFRK